VHTFPLLDDPLVYESLSFPGFLAFLDADGFASTAVAVPNDPLLHGFSFFGAVATYDYPTIAPLKVSTATFVLIP
jgi:hypothetical protein